MTIPSNLEMHDVLAAFHAVPDAATRNYYACPVDPTCPDGMVRSHFKGIAAYANKLIFTHTDLEPGATCGKYLIADRLGAGAEGTVAATYDTDEQNWCHPCSSQACGSFMAMGIQPTDTSGDQSVIQICDLQATLRNEPMQVLGSIARTEGINGVGMTKEAGPGGRYIVAGVNGNSLTLYRSRSDTLQYGQILFDPVYHTSTFAESGAGLALVTQTDGRIFMFTLNADDDGSNNLMCLYSIDLAAGLPLSRVGHRIMPVPGVSQSLTDLLSYMLNNQAPLANAIILILWALAETYMNSSFRWGKGLAITSADTVTVYASDRNVLPLSQLTPTRQDFSLVVWGAPGCEPVPLSQS
ncbi:hypothetical protein IV454_13590 [Massilia antarctica]|uniref:Uncharacterized protein n=1 Tax=Massilia antarctica TaxID=2765360 RepID=A0AA48WIM3_9BURK|nr:hypothetical protein [Massilia antarctica]QPI52423.1 hypothetical protein IV454_13590 [Massilia antarctica]